MIRNLSHISLGTNSLEKVYKFYIEKLGLKIVHKFINKKNGEVYGYFISSNKNTYLEFFNSKKKFTVIEVKFILDIFFLKLKIYTTLQKNLKMIKSKLPEVKLTKFCNFL